MDCPERNFWNFARSAGVIMLCELISTLLQSSREIFCAEPALSERI